MCSELHGKVSEDEPKNIPAFPGIPDGSQRECNGNGPESWSIAELDAEVLRHNKRTLNMSNCRVGRL